MRFIFQMNRFFIMILFTLLMSCSSDNNKSTNKLGKSRSEQLEEIPYRGEVMKDEIRIQITDAIQQVIDKSESLNEPSIYYLVENDRLEKLSGNWKDGSSAIKDADELWRTKKLVLTLVLFPSFSQNAVTGKVDDVWIIEVNHKTVTRTCRMYFDTSSPKELTKLSC